MCANYTPSSRLQLIDLGLQMPTFDYGEAFPGSRAPIVRRAASYGAAAPRAIECLPASFGLLPPWAKPELFRSTYNARSETVATKPSFRGAWKARQFCWIPAECIYEPNYESGKAVRWRIANADGSPLLIAGLWESRMVEDHPQWSFTMLTVNADEHPLMRRFHAPDKEKRSVVMLDAAGCDAWLHADSIDDRLALLQVAPAEQLTAQPAPKAKPGADKNPLLF